MEDRIKLTAELLHKKYDMQLLTKREVSKEMNISEGTLDNIRRSGDIENIKIGGQVMFTLCEVARFINEGSK